MKIPETFRPAAKAKAARLLLTAMDEDRQQRIINQIAEEEWAQDRIEWRAYMNEARNRFYRMHPTPQDRVNYEHRR